MHFVVLGPDRAARLAWLTRLAVLADGSRQPERLMQIKMCDDATRGDRGSHILLWQSQT